MRALAFSRSRGHSWANRITLVKESALSIEWSRMLHIGEMTESRAAHQATVLSDGRVLVAGGCTEHGVTASAEINDVEDDRWMPAGDMTEAR